MRNLRTVRGLTLACLMFWVGVCYLACHRANLPEAEKRRYYDQAVNELQLKNSPLLFFGGGASAANPHVRSLAYKLWQDATKDERRLRVASVKEMIG